MYACVQAETAFQKPIFVIQGILRRVNLSKSPDRFFNMTVLSHIIYEYFLVYGAEMRKFVKTSTSVFLPNTVLPHTYYTGLYEEAKIG